jgi:hypothetical protein
VTKNHFETQARYLKVQALTAHIRELVAMLGLTSDSDGYIVADLIRDWGDAEWNSAAINIGKKPNGNKPLVGFETRLAVINGFVDRARKQAS